MDSNNNSANMKLESGMLCLVIGYHSDPHNLGKVVILEKVAQCGDITPSGGTFRPSNPGVVWLVKGAGLNRCQKGVNGDTYVTSGYAFHSEGHLMPIRPEEDPLEITDVITKKEKA